MSHPPSSKQYIDELADDCQFEHFLSQLQQEWPIRDQVATALREANAAFAAQCTDPDGYRFSATCDELARFLDLKIALESAEQKLLVQVLQVALAMHENAINNPVLTPVQRSSHQLATTSLLPLCKSVLNKSITDRNLWCHMHQLVTRAELAHAKATNELDLSKYLDFDNVQFDLFSGSEEKNRAPSAAPSPASVNRAPESLRPRASIKANAGSTARPASLREKAMAMLNDMNKSPRKTAPLGRRHTAPTLETGSRASASRASSKAHSRVRGLQALQEAEE